MNKGRRQSDSIGEAGNVSPLTKGGTEDEPAKTVAREGTPGTASKTTAFDAPRSNNGEEGAVGSGSCNSGFTLGLPLLLSGVFFRKKKK